MPSLRAIHAAHAPLLLLDAASAVIHAGWWERDTAPRWSSLEEEAGAGIFMVLEQLEAEIGRAGAFVLCEGPGSTLGIRTSAMAVRTWQVLRSRPILTYRSLELLAHAVGRPGLTLIVDARKRSWHALTVDANGRPGPLRRAAPEALQPPFATPSHFRHWSPTPPVSIETLPYDVPALWSVADADDLLRASAEPDAFQHEDPSYVTWTPRIHQARPSR